MLPDTDTRAAISVSAIPRIRSSQTIPKQSHPLMNKKVGRPKTQIDLEQAEKLGMLQCTLEECSAWFKIPVSTLGGHPEFQEAYKRGKQNGKQSLRRYQWNMAKTNCSMAIWLGKQYLGQTDTPVDSDADDVTVMFDEWDDISEL